MYIENTILNNYKERGKGNNSENLNEFLKRFISQISICSNYEQKKMINIFLLNTDSIN